jgi:hypothetical protein
MRHVFVAMLFVLIAGLINFGAAPGLAQNASSEAGGQMQPQGRTGPLDTKSGGAPASSPQGETPPGMQAAPHGSSEKIDTPPPPK